MRVLSVASEAVPLCKTGGLADVVSGLALAQRDQGVDTRILLPAYPGLVDAAAAEPGGIELGDPLGFGPARLRLGRLPATEAPVWLLECPTLYERPGELYVDERGGDHHDNHRRFGLLGRVAAMIGLGFAGSWQPDVVHAHDWQAGLAPAYLRWWGGQRPGIVLTIHNLHFQGRFDPSVGHELAFPPGVYGIDGVECYGSASFLKAGLVYADAITTVSPTYATEIQTPIGGEGLDGLLRSRARELHGILNGIDDATWNPTTDPHIAATYDARTLDGKSNNKAALQRAAGLIVDDAVPLIGSVGRLTWQKGIDLLLGALPQLLELGGQLCVLGSGDGSLENALATAAQENPGRVGFVRGYDEALSHQVIAGSDMLTVPSRFEPCGLTQLYAMRYGTPPIVRGTGGLVDTVTDADDDPNGRGFRFGPPTSQAAADAIARAIAAYTDRDRFSALAKRGMATDFSWREPARRYLELYRDCSPNAVQH